MKSIWFGLFIGLLLVFLNVKYTAAQTKPTAPKVPLKITPAAIAQKPSTAKPTAAPPQKPMEKQTPVPSTQAPSATKPPSPAPLTTTAKPPISAVKTG